MELQARDLRIGNWVNFKSNKQDWGDVRIETNFFRYLDKDWEYNPIPLTEDWLLKFGWGKSEEHELCDNSNDVLFYYDYHFKRFWIEIDVDMVYLPHIKHVHSLQNLYFALCGKELTLK